MPKVLSLTTARCFSANGAVKLGQPVPLSNFWFAANNGRPHNLQQYTPGFLLLRRTPQNGRSVPWFSNTSRSSRVSADSSVRRCSGDGGERSKSCPVSLVESSGRDI